MRVGRALEAGRVEAARGVGRVRVRVRLLGAHARLRGIRRSLDTTSAFFANPMAVDVTFRSFNNSE